MPHAGIRTRFKLDNASGTLVDISRFLDNIQPSSDQEWLDAGTFQPDEAVPIKEEIPGFSTKGYSLTGKWSEEAEAYFSSIEGKQNLEYEYTPAAGDGVDTVITGLANGGGYSGPASDTNGVINFSFELRVKTRTLGGSPA